MFWAVEDCATAQVAMTIATGNKNINFAMRMGLLSLL
jgi:hypothetical protein